MGLEPSQAQPMAYRKVRKRQGLEIQSPDSPNVIDTYRSQNLNLRSSSPVFKETGYDPSSSVYDMEYAECTGSELDFWVGESKKFGFRVLEFAVGTGRIAIPLARHGFEVSGVDSSLNMLDQARAKKSLLPFTVQRRLKFKHGLMQDCRIDLVFDLAFVGFNSYLLLPDRDSRIDTLLNASAHVRPGGGIAVDVFAAVPLDTEPDHEEVEFLERDRATGLRVTRERFYSHNSNHNRGQSTLVYRFYENQVMVCERRLGYSLALVSRDDVVSEFSDAGLEIDGVYGSYDRVPWQPSSPNLIVVGRTTSVDT